MLWNTMIGGVDDLRCQPVARVMHPVDLLQACLDERFGRYSAREEAWNVLNQHDLRMKPLNKIKHRENGGGTLVAHASTAGFSPLTCHRERLTRRASRQDGEFTLTKS